MKIAVIGQGYIGLPLTIEALNVGHTVFAVESDEDRLASLLAGRSYIPDVPSEAVAEALNSARLYPLPSLDGVFGIDVFVISVPTPTTAAGDPDLGYVDEAIDSIAGVVKDGALVIVESTLYPGALRNHVAPRLEGASGGRVGDGLYLSYSPERIDPGRTEIALREIPKLVSGLCPDSAVMAQKFYETMFEQVHIVSSSETAEFVKLFENTFRYVNIAFVNELARAAREVSVDFREVVAAAATKPYGFMPFYHGPGVGGHCLPNNVRYLNHALRKFGRSSSLLASAVAVNESAPAYVVDRLARSLEAHDRSLSESSVMVVGLAYKAGVPDVRDSPALDVIGLLRQRGADICVADTLAADTTRHLGFRQVTPTAEECRSVDAVVIVTDQIGIDYDVIARESALVLDCRGRFGPSLAEQL